MKKILFFFLFSIIVFAYDNSFAQTSIKVFDTVLFFDGYAAKVSTPAPPAGIIRHRNDLYARKLTDQELASIGNTLRMNVTIKAACDNYDRIGNVNMALVPKGSTIYNPDSVQHLELGRFITPFMNKNKMPDTVPYTYLVNNVAHLFKEKDITDKYDVWIELQVFGAPYAANVQIAGCAGRSDVFYGSLEFITNDAVAAENNNVLLPLSFMRSVNNYTAVGTDTAGKTTVTINFNVATQLTDAAIFLITSNHGSNQGGEEYSRRDHHIYVDDVLKLSYKPGSNSCEALREYNTQSNGIYSSIPKTDAQWQSFSNWCPGDTIPIRRINLGALSVGAHSFMIRVPDAQFVDSQGYIPLSVYLHGKTSGTLNIDSPIPTAANNLGIYPNPAFDKLNINISGIITTGVLQIFDLVGRRLVAQDCYCDHAVVDVNALPAGLYDILYTNSQGWKSASKFIKN